MGRIPQDRGLKYEEINIDVYPYREKETIERTGSASVPQIIFNERLLGGIGRPKFVEEQWGIRSEAMRDGGEEVLGDGAEGPFVRIRR
ncbi:hypothetical protein QJS10_CPB20g01727 [Acorus calamus]|uniref:Glutaredoxin domain-containing protein n=1 Tax=Acorus calamus TaxID=4465 RepID=A0AAV9CAU8_ACOCL|nr:hypothetical protein QJS10_CPB20g01727 [Acorus calamus]